MNKLFIVAVCLILLLIQHLTSVAQTGFSQRHSIAVFVPLYLDSAFDATGEYRYGKSFPKFINPGLEFYEGVQLAVDSLNKTQAPLDVHVYDTRSTTTPVSKYLQQPEFSSIDLIIGHVNNTEARLLADAAKKKSIPFINTNIPNDMGITNNPSLVILNSTLRTHLQSIYKFLQRSYATSPIVVFRQKGAQDDILKNYFTEIEQTTASFPVKLQFVTLTDDFSASRLIPYLDSTRVTMCIAGSLDAEFAKQLCRHLASLNKTYPVQVMGMPTWDGIKDLEKKQYKGLEIFYSTPFYNAKTDKISTSISNYFKNNIFSRPTDMVFRGYECLLRFGKLLLEHGPNLNSSIGEKKYKVFTDFDIQPVFLNKQSMTLDYFENRKLYIVKMVDGEIKGVY